MADSKQLRILKALATQIATVDVLSADTVSRGRNKFDENDLIDEHVVILEAPKQGTPVYLEDHTEQIVKWELYLQGFVTDDIANPTDPAHDLLAKVKQKLIEIRTEGSSSYRLNGLIVDIEIDSGICRPPDEFVQKAYFLLNVRISFVEDLENPYA